MLYSLRNLLYVIVSSHIRAHICFNNRWVLIGLIVVIPFGPSQNTYAVKIGNCNPTTLKSLWDHTYGAGLLVHGQTSRLKPLSPECVVFDGHVSGTSSTRQR